MATIKDVSKAAGVSVATVSRVLNGKGQVAPGKVKSVLDAVHQLSFAPNVSARNLRRHESRIILIMAPNVTNPYYAHIIAGVEHSAHQSGYSSFLCNTEGDREQEEQLLRMLLRGQADGAILLAVQPGSHWLKPYAGRFPLVACSEFDPSLPIAHVSIDNYQASKEVMAYLLSLGHTRIGMITCGDRYNSTALRLRGYRDALTFANISLREEYVRDATQDATFESGFDAARNLLSQERRPTALFCTSDMLALGALASTKEMGFRVPEDVTIVGFGDVEHTCMFHPYLTTMAQPCFDLGRCAMEMLFGQLENGPVDVGEILPHKLMVRESSGPHRGFEDFAIAIASR